jgi:hypothetical protein
MVSSSYEWLQLPSVLMLLLLYLVPMLLLVLPLQVLGLLWRS